ncbi:hypothetical protein EBR66_01145 [bacterium]|nr:hypothetical protein [bacterium]
MDYMHGGMGMGFGLPVMFGSFFFIILIWSLLWKGLALWRAAKRDDNWWFVAFLILNTAGILEIVYLFAVTGAKLSDFTGPLTSQASGAAQPEKKDVQS